MSEKKSKDRDGLKVLEVTSGYGLNYGPFVTLKWGSQETQMSLEECRHHAMACLMAAEGAETDSMIYEFVTKDLGGPITAAGEVMIMFRERRDALSRLRNNIV